MPSDSHVRIYTVVSMIPKGCVATYGQVAELAGLPRQARLLKREKVRFNQQGVVDLKAFRWEP